MKRSPNIFVNGNAQEKRVFLTSGFQLPFQEEDLLSQIDNAAMFQGYSSGGCYDEETEVLTDQGWKYFKNLNGDEKFYTLNPKTKKIELQKATGYIKRYYSGNMYHFKSNTFDLLVTPDHNMAVSGNGKEYKEIKLIKAKELVENYSLKSIKFPKYGLWTDGYNGDEIEINGLKFKTEDFIRFMGYYLSDGCAINETKKPGKSVHYSIILTAKKERKVKVYREIFNELGLKSSEHKTSRGSINFVIGSNKRLWNFLNPLGKSKEKYIPDILKNMSKKFLDIFLDSLLFGDGNITGGKDMFYTSSIRLAEDVQEIAMKLGRNALIRKRTRNYRIEDQSGIREGIATSYEVCIKRRKSKSFVVNNVEVIDYQGMIYCVEVPNHILYVKREKSPVWCGNSILHVFTNEELTAEQQIKMVKAIMCNFPVYYITKTPFLTTCNTCGHRMVGRKNECEKCSSNDITLWSRPIGYFRPVMRGKVSKDFKHADHYFWLNGRVEDFATRKEVKKEDIEHIVEEISGAM